MSEVIPPVVEPFAVCRECEHHQIEKVADLTCPECGETMVEFRRMPEAERITFRGQAWFKSLRRHGLQGLSPGGASAKLGCHRSMIDKLVDMGVLERSVYDRDGIFMVFISLRSIERALKSKKETGKWTKLKEDES